MSAAAANGLVQAITAPTVSEARRSTTISTMITVRKLKEREIFATLRLLCYLVAVSGMQRGFFRADVLSAGPGLATVLPGPAWRPFGSLRDARPRLAL